MKKALIRKGDPTSHGGTVLEGCERVRAVGQPVASKGHMTYCPTCRGNFPIAEGVSKLTAFGANVAVEGMKTTCGATLIATQHSVNVVTDDVSQLPTGGRIDSSRHGTEAPKAGYSGRFRAVDDRTGAPVADLPYFVELPDGQRIRGATDDEGYTELFSSDVPAEVRLHWISDRSPEAGNDSAGETIC